MGLKPTASYLEASAIPLCNNCVPNRLVFIRNVATCRTTNQVRWNHPEGCCGIIGFVCWRVTADSATAAGAAGDALLSSSSMMISPGLFSSLTAQLFFGRKMNVSRKKHSEEIIRKMEVEDFVWERKKEERYKKTMKGASISPRLQFKQEMN